MLTAKWWSLYKMNSLLCTYQNSMLLNLHKINILIVQHQKLPLQLLLLHNIWHRTCPVKELREALEITGWSKKKDQKFWAVRQLKNAFQGLLKGSYEPKVPNIWLSTSRFSNISLWNSFWGTWILMKKWLILVNFCLL